MRGPGASPALTGRSFPADDDMRPKPERRGRGRAPAGSALAAFLAVGLVAAGGAASPWGPRRGPPDGAAPASPQVPQRAVPDDASRGRRQRAPAPQRAPQAFGATVARVRVDVIVTDGDGDFVADLAASDFSVFEDGEPQEILDVQLVDLIAGEVRTLRRGETTADAAAGGGGAREGAGVSGARGGIDPTGAAAAAASAAAGAGPGDAIPGGDSPTAAGELGAVIFLIDGPSLNQQAKARFGDAWGKLLEQTEDSNLPRAAYMVDNVGRLQELAPLGDDLQAMRAAADTVRAAPLFGNTINRRLYEIVADLTSPAFEGAPEDLRQVAIAKARSFELEERFRTLATYELLTSFTEALSSRSGRTALVWVSSGIKLMQGGPFSAVFAAGEPSPTAAGMGGAAFDLYSPDPQIEAARQALHRAANSANVSFYSVDPSLLSETRLVAADVELGTAVAAGYLATHAMQQSLDGLRDALRTAAAETGGRSFIHATDLGAALEEIEADTSRFYLLTYAPPAPEGDGEYHEIRVEVGRDDARVRARAGYTDHPAGDRVRRSLAAALALPGAVSGLPVEAEAFVSRPPDGAPNVLLAVGVEGAELEMVVDAAGERSVSLDVHTLAVDGGDAVTEAHEQLTGRSGAGGLAPRGGAAGGVPGAGGASGLTLVGTMAYQHEFTLEPGSYTFHVAVLDNVSGRIGATTVDVTVPPAGAGWGTSDPLLVTVDEAGRPQPVVLGRVLAEQNLAAFVEVYGGEQPILSGRVFAQTAEGGDSVQSARLLPMALRQVGAGRHRGSTPLPPGLPAGRYIVQLTITDPPAGQHRIVRLRLEVVEPRGR
jgi:VWFA-related protein